MAAQSKQDLLSLAEKEFAKLELLLEKLPIALQLEADGEGISPKDIVAHRAHWIELFTGWYADGQLGKTVHFPAKGYKWNETRRYNADLRKQQEDMSWLEAVALLEQNHLKLMDLVEKLSDQDLYAGPMKGANNAWTTGRWAEAAGPSHYRSAAKYLRQRLREFEQRAEA
ncbi:ClbS/DfsB family four-helix bundle protein [uncultured Roseibium sp.]|uniref:ClbS/DfsB family four-helix bundle protein n=1 Tax=uncultured Roseibium sp. TaxID=1936171 RepID=UPI00260DF943|nr:ClbS/DfsB family four-helix bundle protein [uncultured Roseibium sp.]